MVRGELVVVERLNMRCTHSQPSRWSRAGGMFQTDGHEGNTNGFACEGNGVTAVGKLTSQVTVSAAQVGHKQKLGWQSPFVLD